MAKTNQDEKAKDDKTKVDAPVQVHFLVDTRIGDQVYLCDARAMVPESVARALCDNDHASVERVT